MIYWKTFQEYLESPADLTGLFSQALQKHPAADCASLCIYLSYAYKAASLIWLGEGDF